MESRFVLLSAGESFHTLTECRSGPRIGVGNDPGRNSVQKSKCVELVEQGLGCCHRAWCGVGELIQHGHGQLVEFSRGKYPRYQSNRFCLARTENSSGTDQIESNLFSDRPP